MKHASLLLFVLTSLVAGCSVIPLPPTTPPAPNTLVYDAPVTMMLKNATPLAGTGIVYNGKAATGEANVLINGQLAQKKVGDSLDWQGMPAPNTSLRLATRVASYDDQGLTVIGTAHIEIANATVASGGAPRPTQMEFNAPVTFTLERGKTLPGSTVSYVGSATEGAQFAGIEGYPYRKSLDSLVYRGRLNPRVFLALELRVLNFSETSALLGGTASIRIEAP